MIKRDQIAFLQILTVFGYKIEKLVTKKPTTQEMKFSVKDFLSKLNQIPKRCGFYHIY